MFRNKKNLDGLTLIFTFVLAVSTSFCLHTTSYALRNRPVLDSGIYNLQNPEEDTYWTPERMKAVPPVDSSHRFFKEFGSLTTPSNDEPQGLQMASKATPASQTSPSLVKRAPTIPAGFLGAPSKLPLKTTGKLFITYVNGSASCSGNAVSSNNGSVVNTAAHCLYDEQTGTLAKRAVFCPQYKNGNCPVGKWVAKSILINPKYTTTNGSPSEDFGMVVVFPRNGKTLVNTIGGDGWMINSGKFTKEKPFGYPANINNGEVLFTCNTTLQVPVSGSSTLRKLPKCTMGEGSSGGPWYMSINGLLYVNGHNDVGPQDDSFIISPSYGSKWFTNFDRAQKIRVK